MGDRRVAVVGAGPAGLAALRALTGAGVDATAFERGSRVGGVWTLEDRPTAAYRSLHLITGCSTGIGRATAERLAERGHVVYASARRLESIADLEAKGCRTLAVDVTDEVSMRAAVATIERADGAVRALVNNAG
jgi:NADPH-dependent 2,4-dienoyl-CoA reductase/sulfur reductase-like enzyme